MNDQNKQHEQALKALISVNKAGVKALLRSYKYKISDLYSDQDLYAFLIVAMSKDITFTEGVLTLLKRASNQPYRYADSTWSSGDTSSVISGALQGIGIFASAWQGVAKTKANASMYNTTYTTDGKKQNTFVIGAVILVGILLVGVAGVMIVSATKK
jgi:hypothetical protein